MSRNENLSPDGPKSHHRGKSRRKCTCGASIDVHKTRRKGSITVRTMHCQVCGAKIITSERIIDIIPAGTDQVKSPGQQDEPTGQVESP